MPFRCIACEWTGSYDDTVNHSIETGHDTYAPNWITNEQINKKETSMNPVVLKLFREAICHKYILWEILSQIETMVIHEGLRVEDTPEIAEAAIDDLASRINSPLGVEELTSLTIGRAVFPTIYGTLGRTSPKRDPLKGLKKKKKRLVAPLPKQRSLPEGYNPYALPATPESWIDEAEEAIANAMRFGGARVPSFANVSPGLVPVPVPVVPDPDDDSEDEHDSREAPF